MSATGNNTDDMAALTSDPTFGSYDFSSSTRFPARVETVLKAETEKLRSEAEASGSLDEQIARYDALVTRFAADVQNTTDDKTKRIAEYLRAHLAALRDRLMKKQQGE